MTLAELNAHLALVQELKKAEAGLAVGGALKVRVLFGQDLVAGALYGAVALDVGVDEAAEIGGVPP